MDAKPAWGSLPFAQAIEFFRGKQLVPTEQWTDLVGAGHDTGFMVSGVTKMDLLADLWRSIDKAQAEGIPLTEWKKQFGAILDKHGWEPKQGRDWRAKVILEHNIRTAYQAGRYRQMSDPAVMERMPYWLYRHSEAARVPRPLHLAWNGLVLPANDPWFRTHYPPNGWGCKCRVFAISRQELARMGRSGPDKPPEDGNREWTNPSTGKTVLVPNGIDPGWDYAPGMSLVERAEAVATAKLATMPPELAKVVKQDLIKPRARLSLDSAMKIGARIRDELIGKVDFAKAGSQQAWQEALLAKLRQDVGAGESRLIAANRGAFDAVVQEVAAMLPRSWVDAVNIHGPVDVESIPDRAYYQNGKLYLRDPENGRTALHELAHHIQHLLPKLDAIFQTYHRRRTKGERLVPLSKLRPGSGCAEWEQAKPDKYLSPYFGKEYTGFGALEMLPMAMTLVLGIDTISIRRALTEDPDMVALGLGVLFGYKP